MNTLKIILAIIIVLITFSLFTQARVVEKDEYDCKDFKNQREAMHIFHQNTTDIYDLDRDNDDIPCESLPL